MKPLQRINELSNLLSLTINSLLRLKSWEPLPLNLTQLDISHCLSLAFVLKEDLEMIMSVRTIRIAQIVTFFESCTQKSGGYGSVDWQIKRVQEMMKSSDYIDEQALSTISKDLKKCLEKMLDLICKLSNVDGELYLPLVLEKLEIGSCFITDKNISSVFARSQLSNPPGVDEYHNNHMYTKRGAWFLDQSHGSQIINYCKQR